MSKPKLTEYEWLEKSLISFNGSGYADRRSAGSFMDSYLAYQQWKVRAYGIKIADKFWGAGLNVAVTLINTSDGPSRVPTYRKLLEFAKYYPAALDDIAPPEPTASSLEVSGYTGGLRCKICGDPIQNAFQNELICFDCWNAHHLSQTQRHNHKIQPPKPGLVGMV